ncbi:MAG: hypothetical protein ABI462_14290 [Ignavibacteria bacterium]
MYTITNNCTNYKKEVKIIILYYKKRSWINDFTDKPYNIESKGTKEIDDPEYAYAVYIKNENGDIIMLTETEQEIKINSNESVKSCINCNAKKTVTQFR